MTSISDSIQSGISDTTDLGQGLDQTLASIASIQEQERALLDKGQGQGQGQGQDQQINELVQMRANLYKTIKETKLQTDMQHDHKVAIDLMERELNRLKQQLNDAKEAKYRKLRLIEINTYYGKRYQSYAHLFKTMAFFALMAAPIAILTNKGWIPDLAGTFVIGFIIILASIQVGLQVIDLSNRSRHNWDEYDWYFNPHHQKQEDIHSNASDPAAPINPWTSASASGSGHLTCIGQQCCDQRSSYDAKLNRCVSFA